MEDENEISVSIYVIDLFTFIVLFILFIGFLIDFK